MERKDATDTFTTRADESGTAILSRHETTSRGQQRVPEAGCEAGESIAVYGDLS